MMEVYEFIVLDLIFNWRGIGHREDGIKCKSTIAVVLQIGFTYS